MKTGELVAFVAYAISYPNHFLALVDTYDTLKSGVPNFLIVALALHELGYKAEGIRLDSGDLAYLSKESRRMFKQFASTHNVDYFSRFTIVASNDITEQTIISLNQEGHQIDAFGIGTNLVTCKSQPALGCVYKLVEMKATPRIKLSQQIGKVTIPCKKDVYRLYGPNHYPLVDLLQICGREEPPKEGVKLLVCHPFDQKKRALLAPTKIVPLLEVCWKDGLVQCPLPSLLELKNFVNSQVDNLREDHVRFLNPTPYKVSVTQHLFTLTHEMWLKEAPITEITI